MQRIILTLVLWLQWFLINDANAEIFSRPLSEHCHRLGLPEPEMFDLNEKKKVSLQEHILKDFKQSYLLTCLRPKGAHNTWEVWWFGPS